MRVTPNRTGHRSQGRRASLVAGLSLVLLAGGCTGPASAPQLDAEAGVSIEGSSTVPASTFDPSATPGIDLVLQESQCVADSDVDRAQQRADDVMRGVVVLGRHPPAQLSAELDWSVDPFASTNWQFNLHSLRFLWPVIQIGAALPDGRYMDRAVTIAEDWVADNPSDRASPPYAWDDHATAWRAMVLACLWEHRQPLWLLEALEFHGNTLASEEFYVGRGNHALNQNLGLLHVACALGEPQHAALALDRLTVLVGESVDAQGVTVEQAVGYQQYNYLQYIAAIEAIARCGLDVDDRFSVVELMPEFLGHATLPDGTLASIGDTDRPTLRAMPDGIDQWLRSNGRRGTPREAVAAVYDAGFGFGRTSWGEPGAVHQETMYTVRFGPSRAFHGHADGGSVTLYSHGSRLIVDPGKYEYDPGPLREHVTSAFAHNVVLPLAPCGGDTQDHQMQLVDVDVGGDLDRIELSGRLPGCDATSWRRTVVFSRSSGSLLVVDAVTPETPVTVQWQLEQGSVVAADDTSALVTNAEAVVHVFALSGAAGFSVREGEDDPIAGWIAPEYGAIVPAPVLRSAPAEAGVLVTLLVPGGAAEAAPTAVLEATIGAHVCVVVTLAGGADRLCA